MAGNPKEMLKEFQNGLGAVQKTNGEQVKAFMNMLGACDKPGEVDAKTKELISIGIALVIRCEYCIVYHVYEALKAGATREEIMEAGMVALTFGAGPTMTYVTTLLKDSIAAFAPEFE